MRIWDLPVSVLCHQHLLGEHRELHAIWTYLTTNKGGSYRKHPETLRWKDRLPNLYNRHSEQVAEMKRRGFGHRTPLDATLILPVYKLEEVPKINTIDEQIANIKSKGCPCQI